MESLAATILFLALLFVRQSRKVSHGMKRCKESDLRFEDEEKCWSRNWVMKNVVMSRRHIFHPSFLGVMFLIVGTWALAGVFALAAIVLLGAVGYVPLLILVALAMIMDPEAYQAYSYVGAVVTVSVDQLSKEDEDYMLIAREALNRKALRFVVIAIVFAVLGPFIPSIFSWLTYTLAVYVSVLFKATEVSSKISVILTLVIILVAPGIFVYFPEFLGRMLLSVLKKMTNRVLKLRLTA